jgi:hypothetical protein
MCLPYKTKLISDCSRRLFDFSIVFFCPEALIMVEIIFPETDQPQTMGKSVDVYYEKDSNVFEVVINGT